MIRFLRYLKNSSPKFLAPFWFFFGNIYRFIVKEFNINFYIHQKISSYGPYRIHCFFAFSNFKSWGSENNDIFPLMMKKCKNKKCIIDIGAHVGLMTLPFSSILKKSAQIFSFEPSDINCKYLIYHLRTNKINNVKVVNKLLGIKNANHINFYESNYPTGMNSIIKTRKKINFIKRKKKQITLDSFVKKNNIKPDLIKIDAEGAELYILLGAIKTIKKYKPDIYLSFHKEHLKKLGFSEKDFQKIIKEIGYKIKDPLGNLCKTFKSKEYYLHY